MLSLCGSTTTHDLRLCGAGVDTARAARDPGTTERDLHRDPGVRLHRPAAVPVDRLPRRRAVRARAPGGVRRRSSVRRHPSARSRSRSSARSTTLPEWLYPVLWPFQQFGNLLVVGDRTLIVACLVLRQWKVAPSPSLAAGGAQAPRREGGEGDRATLPSGPVLPRRRRDAGRRLGTRPELRVGPRRDHRGDRRDPDADPPGLCCWKPVPWLIVASNGFTRIYVGAQTTHSTSSAGSLAVGVAIAAVLDAPSSSWADRRAVATPNDPRPPRRSRQRGDRSTAPRAPPGQGLLPRRPSTGTGWGGRSSPSAATVLFLLMWSTTTRSAIQHLDDAVVRPHGGRALAAPRRRGDSQLLSFLGGTVCHLARSVPS